MKKMVTEKEIAEIAARFPRFVRWSEEDACFIGSLPDLDGDCAHGDTPEKVAEELKICAELAIEARLKFDLPIPEPRAFVITPSRFREDGNQGHIQALRRSLGLSQAAFAKVLGVSKNTICSWEQGHRKPDGAAARLLQIAEKHPEAVLGHG